MSPSIRSIVVATDFSPPSDRALERAARLASLHGARLELVHASPLPIPMPVWGDMAGGTWIENSELVEAGQLRLRAIADALATRHPDIEISGHCEAAPAIRLVLARAEARAADLTVIGATGEGAIARRLFGSTAQGIARDARRPLLIVRRSAGAAYRNLLIATDFSQDALRAARIGRALVPHAHAVLFHALEQPRYRFDLFDSVDESTRQGNLERARSLVYERLQDLGAALQLEHASIKVCNGRASHELDQLLRESDFDLLAIGAHGKSRLEAGLLGSTSLHAVAEAPCDVLIVPHQDTAAGD